MRKTVLMMSFLVQVLAITAQANLSSLNCEVDLVKHDGTFSVLSSGPVGVNSITKNGKFDTFKAGPNGLDANNYRVEVTLNPSGTGYATNVQLIDRVGPASSSFFTNSDGTHIISSLDATGKYQVLGDASNFRIYLECK